MHNNSCSERRCGSRFGILRIIGFTVGGITLAVLFALLFGWLVQLLWNWLMPTLFSLKAITYWQAFGIVVLAKILFGGFSPHHGSHRYGRHFRPWRHHQKYGTTGTGTMPGNHTDRIRIGNTTTGIGMTKEKRPSKRILIK